MNTVITSLTSTVSNANLWAEVGNAVPLIGVAILFALGYRIVSKSLNGISKHKQKM